MRLRGGTGAGRFSFSTSVGELPEAAAATPLLAVAVAAAKWLTAAALTIADVGRDGLSADKGLSGSRYDSPLLVAQVGIRTQREQGA